MKRAKDRWEFWLRDGSLQHISFSKEDRDATIKEYAQLNRLFRLIKIEFGNEPLDYKVTTEIDAIV